MAKSCDGNTVFAKITAKGFQGTRAIELPVSVPMNEETPWAVSVLRSKSRHHSLLFEATKHITFYIDLLVVNKEVTLHGKDINLQEEKYKTLTKAPLGTITASIAAILDIASSVLEKLGKYNFLTMNCQVIFPYVLTCMH